MRLLREILIWVGRAWTLPNTALGLLLGALDRARPQNVSGVLEVRLRRRGPVRAVCERLGISAFTMGDCVVYAVPPTEALRVHEGRHVFQYHVLGPFFLPIYFALLATYRYEKHPLERDARRHEMRMLGRTGPSRLLPRE